MVSAMWSRVLRRSGSRTHGKWAVVFLLAGASKSRWFWSSSRLKSGRLSSANFHVRSRTVSHSSKNFSIFPVIRKLLRRSALVLLGFNTEDVRVLLAVPLGLSWVVVGACLWITQDGPQGGHVVE